MHSLISTHHISVQHTEMEAEGRDKLDKRGYVYQCRGCNKYEGERRYVEAHYFKSHTALDVVPFYCSLCHFMGKTEREVIRQTPQVGGGKPKTARERTWGDENISS